MSFSHFSKKFSLHLIKSGVRYASGCNKLFEEQLALVASKSGKKPKTIDQILAEMDYKDPAIYYKVNIGYSPNKRDRLEALPQRIQTRKNNRNNYEMEKLAKTKRLNVPLDEIYTEWQKTLAPMQIKKCAEYYSIYDDLFEDAYFYPLISMDIKYEFRENPEFVTPVYMGNLIKPTEADKKPEIFYEPAKKDDLYTLVMSSPDCHFTKERGEYVHWLVANIPGNEINKGKEIIDYMQPFPPRGLGYCRYVFVLYRQEKSIDCSKYERALPCTNLTARDFYTYDFYKEFQDLMTPIGLQFFQSDWDVNVTDFYHKILDMQEPTFEYDFDPLPKEEELWYPWQKPFNLYMDEHKDPKVLQRELLMEKLKERHPFRRPPKPPKYPMAFHIPHTVPTWLKDDMQKKAMREGKWKFM